MQLAGKKAERKSHVSLQRELAWLRHPSSKPGNTLTLLKRSQKFQVTQAETFLTLVMQNRARRKVPRVTPNVKSFRCLFKTWKSSARPVMTASMPPIWREPGRWKAKMRIHHVYDEAWDLGTLATAWSPSSLPFSALLSTLLSIWSLLFCHLLFLCLPFLNLWKCVRRWRDNWTLICSW